MTRLFLTLTTLFFITISASLAYAQPGRGMDPEQQIKELIAQLDITGEQEPAFRAAMVELNTMRMADMGQMRGRRDGQDRGQEQDSTVAHAGQGAGGDQADTSADQAGRDEMMEQRRAQMEEKTRTILAPVLSSAQLGKYIELEQARMAQMMTRMRR